MSGKRLFPLLALLVLLSVPAGAARLSLEAEAETAEVGDCITVTAVLTDCADPRYFASTVALSYDASMLAPVDEGGADAVSVGRAVAPLLPDRFVQYASSLASGQLSVTTALLPNDKTPLAFSDRLELFSMRFRVKALGDCAFTLQQAQIFVGDGLNPAAVDAGVLTLTLGAQPETTLTVRTLDRDTLRPILPDAAMPIAIGTVYTAPHRATIIADGLYYEYDESSQDTLTCAQGANEIALYYRARYRFASENLIDNGDFEDGYRAWTVGSGTGDNTLQGTAPMSDAGFAYQTDGDNHFVTTRYSASGHSSGAIKRGVTLEADRSYFFTCRVRPTDAVTNSYFALEMTEASGLDVLAKNGYTAEEIAAHRAATNSLVATSQDAASLTSFPGGEWTTLTRVFHTTQRYQTFFMHLRYLGIGTALDDFALYELGELSPRMTKITVVPPAKTRYALGEALDLSGMQVTAHYTDGSFAVCDDYTVIGYDSQLLGEQTVTVQVNGCTDTFLVTVQDGSARLSASVEEVRTAGSRLICRTAVRAEVEGTLVLALYSAQGELLALHRTDSAADSVTLTAVLPQGIAVRDCTLRVFLWGSDLSLLLPLSEAESQQL